MACEGFYQVDINRFEGDLTDFVFSIADISSNPYRLTVARDRAFEVEVFQIDGVSDESAGTVTFTPIAANVAEGNISAINPITHFMVQELVAGEPVEASGFGRIRWHFSPD